MKLLMLGWEFPPHSVGGLGTHTYEIVKALTSSGVEVKLVLPDEKYAGLTGVKFLSTHSSKFKSSVYDTTIRYTFGPDSSNGIFAEFEHYTKTAPDLVMTQDFDVIQANDWLTARAGIEIKKRTGKPLVLTMHSTEYDRTIGHPFDFILHEEKNAIKNADVVVAVSDRLKKQLVERYGANPDRTFVVHNAIEMAKFKGLKIGDGSEVILYVGRLSSQKGIDHLIKAFKIVSEHNPNALLYIIGEGPQLKELVDMTVDMGLEDKVSFFGRVPGDDMEDFYSMAKVFVMPSVSEPFGITALEAVASRTPTIISMQSGVAEVLNSVFKIDFWDSEKMADTILGLLRYPGIKETMSSEAYKELYKITWEDSAKKFIDIYTNLLSGRKISR